MKEPARIFVFFLTAAVLSAGIARADTQPVRHLVYNFDITMNTISTVHDSGIDGGPVSGASNYNSGAQMDQGTITVDVMQVQPDTGLVVKIAENARNRRDAVPTLCVTYGNGAVVCDQSHGQLNEEEMNLLRFLGRNFVNPALIDAHNHWRYASTDAQSSETNDYTIGKTTGDLLDISYQRVLKVQGAQGFDATTDGTLTYNKAMTMPVAIKEQTTTRKNTGSGNYDTVRQDMSFTLAQDSMAQAAQTH
jgi:hypothetical protein